MGQKPENGDTNSSSNNNNNTDKVKLGSHIRHHERKVPESVLLETVEKPVGPLSHWARELTSDHESEPQKKNFSSNTTHLCATSRFW